MIWYLFGKVWEEYQKGHTLSIFYPDWQTTRLIPGFFLYRIMLPAMIIVIAAKGG